MMFQVILCLSFAAVVLGKGCCAPKEWEGYEMIAGGYSSRSGRKGSIRSGFKISYDANSLNVAVSGESRRSKTMFKHIYNFKSNVAYIIFPKEMKCTMLQIRAPFPQACIPADAKEFGKSFLGAGDSSLDITTYGVKVTKGRKYSAEGAATVTSNGCIPVSEDWWGMVKGVGFFTNVNFAGITPGIADKTVFSPPEYCEEGTGNYEWLKNDFRILRLTTQEMLDY